MTDYADTADPSPITPGRAATICQIEKKHAQLLNLVDRLVCGKNTYGFINWGNIKDHGMDIFLSTVQKVLEKADQYNPLQPFEAWFSYWANFEIAHAQQKANGRSRTNKVYSLKEEESFDNFPDQKSTPDGEFHPLELAEVAKVLLTRVQSVLNEKDCQLFLAKYLHFQTNEDIATTFGLTKAQVAVKATRLMKKIRDDFTSQEWHDFRYGADKPPSDKKPVRTGAKS